MQTIYIYIYILVFCLADRWMECWGVWSLRIKYSLCILYLWVRWLYTTYMALIPSPLLLPVSHWTFVETNTRRCPYILRFFLSYRNVLSFLSKLKVVHRRRRYRRSIVTNRERIHTYMHKYIHSATHKRRYGASRITIIVDGQRSYHEQYILKSRPKLIESSKWYFTAYYR